MKKEHTSIPNLLSMNENICKEESTGGLENDSKGEEQHYKETVYGRIRQREKSQLCLRLSFCKAYKKGKLFWGGKFEYVKKKTKQARISNVEVNL